MKTFPSKIFIDGGLPEETRQAKEMLGFLDGQTTNPTLIAMNLRDQNLKLRTRNSELTQEEALEEYKRIVVEMSRIIPQGSISIQVFADRQTKSEEMLKQARERHKWIPNSSIKLPCTAEGLKTASVVCMEFPINITLAFSQSQAAAVYEATRQARYPVFVSPFVGRLDDRGENGMQVVANIFKMYETGDDHVEVLTASVRNMDHLLYALQLKSNIITVPFKIFKLWSGEGFRQPDEDYFYNAEGLAAIPYREDINLGKPWQSYDLSHDLTDQGIDRFFSDWNSLFA